MKIMIIGGYGVFGGRLIELLSDAAELELLVCGRNLAKAEVYCAAFQGAAQVRPLKLDRNDIAQALASQQPDLVVDASGPFQHYGDNTYALVKACLKAKVNYLDFADAADFVFGISQFDAAAKAAGVYVLSGVSSFPVLTAAVLREMAKTMQITSVTGGIAPSPYAGIGLNVMRAVVGYAGEPVKLRRGGKNTAAGGLTESMRYTVAVPGRLPLDSIHFSLVDVPDLQVIPPEHDSLQDIWMGAGPVPEVLHRVLNLLAKARAKLPFPSLVPLSGLFYKVLNLAKFGEHRGGMFVHAKGHTDSVEASQSWHLLAEGDDGPYIPSMAIEALVRKALTGDLPAVGARPATHALELPDYEQLFQQRTIFSSLRRPQAPDAPLYEHVLGSAFNQLPDTLQDLHTLPKERRWAGTAEVKRGKGLLAKIIAGLIGFPPAASQVPVSVTLTPEQGGETWLRNFGGTRFTSHQARGTGKNDNLLTERFGIITVALALVVEGDKLFLIPRRWTCLGVPLPRFLLPKGESFETQTDGKFCFNVTIAAPLVGLIVAYKGQLSEQNS